MLLLSLCLFVFVLRTECCESKTFENTRIIVSGRNNENPRDVIVSNCIEHSNETKDYFSIEITNHNLAKLGRGAFVNLPVLTLKLTNNIIKDIDRDSFMGLRSVRSIDLSKNKIKIVQKDVFNNLISLEVLTLSNNEIETIEEFAFGYLVSLQELLLNSNKINTWNPEWFAENNRLKKLDLEDNLIEFIPDTAFVNAPNINTLIFRSNRLRQISSNAFKSLTSLTMLDLSENKLQKLHKDTFAPFSGRKVGGEPEPKPTGLFIANFRPFFGLWNLYIHRNNLTFLAEEIMDDLTANRGFNMLTLYSNPWQCGCYRKIINWADDHRIRVNIWGKGCYHSENPVCIVPKNNSNACLEDISEDIRTVYYSLYKHYTSYDGNDFKVRCNPI